MPKMSTHDKNRENRKDSSIQTLFKFVYRFSWFSKKTHYFRAWLFKINEYTKQSKKTNTFYINGAVTLKLWKLSETSLTIMGVLYMISSVFRNLKEFSLNFRNWTEWTIVDIR